MTTRRFVSNSVDLFTGFSRGIRQIVYSDYLQSIGQSPAGDRRGLSKVSVKQYRPDRWQILSGLSCLGKFWLNELQQHALAILQFKGAEILEGVFWDAWSGDRKSPLAHIEL